MRYLFFIIGLTSLCMIGSGFIYDFGTESVTFLFVAEWYPTEYVCIIPSSSTPLSGDTEVAYVSWLL